MVYRTQPEKEKVNVIINLSTEEYQEAIIEYLVKYKMIPEGINVNTIKVMKYNNGGTGDVRPKVVYTKEIVKLYP